MYTASYDFIRAPQKISPGYTGIFRHPASREHSLLVRSDPVAPWLVLISSYIALALENRIKYPVLVSG
jgi:hypothetical protein